MPTKRLEETHYPSLTLGHPHSSCKDISIVGLDLKIYGLDEIKGNKLPIAAVVSLALTLDLPRSFPSVGRS